MTTIHDRLPSVPVPAEVRIVEIQRDIDGGSPIVILECPLLDGTRKQFPIDFAMAARASSVIAHLRSQDVGVLPDAQPLQEILSRATNDPSLLVNVSRWTGWEGKSSF